MNRLYAHVPLVLFSKTLCAQYVQVSANVLGLAASVPNVQVEGLWTDRLAVEAGP